eukprot:150224-Chlamydomonas_euryale.AAC.1
MPRCCVECLKAFMKALKYVCAAPAVGTASGSEALTVCGGRCAADAAGLLARPLGARPGRCGGACVWGGVERLASLRGHLVHAQVGVGSGVCVERCGAVGLLAWPFGACTGRNGG